MVGLRGGRNRCSWAAWLLWSAVLWLILAAQAQAAIDPKSILPVEQAYRAQVLAEQNRITVQFNIADGYYLYRDKIHFTADSPSLGAAQFSPAQSKTDEFFGTQAVYFQQAQIQIPLQDALLSGKPYHLSMDFQGCAEVGICYPPTRVEFDIKQAGLIEPQSNQAVNVFAQSTPPAAAPLANNDNSSRWNLADGSIWQNLATFFLAGLGLSLTACMYPLLPIVSSIVVGGRRSKRLAFALSVVYVQGLALSYTLVGVLAGLTGALLTVWLQQAWVVLTAAALLVILALAMFDVLRIQLPSAWQAYLQQQSGRLSGGKIASVFGMGILSALIVGPCVAPPLAFALGYIAQSGNAVLGGAALYVLALGTGLPLVLVATFGTHILPKAGAWMNAVKVIFGCLLLAAAVYLARPFLPYWLAVGLYALLIFALGCYIIARGIKNRHHMWLPLIIGAALLGLSAYFGGATLNGKRTALHTALSLQAPNQAHFGRQFSDVEELNAAIKTAFAQDPNRPVLVDFYADWCVTCIQMQMNTFTDPKVKQAVDEKRFFTIDVTANTAEQQALLKQYGLFGPPGIFKLSADGKRSAPLLGFVPANEFVRWSEEAF